MLSIGIVRFVSITGVESDLPALSVLDALHSTPSRRYLSDRPIPVEVVWAILDAAVRGPSGGNRQAWGWVVVTDPRIKQQVGAWYRETWQQAYGPRRDELLTAAPTTVGLSAASYRATEYLADHIHEAPVWVDPRTAQCRRLRQPAAGCVDLWRRAATPTRGPGLRNR